MSFQEVITAAQALRALLFGGAYWMWASAASAAGRLTGEGGLGLLGQALLLYCLATVVGGIALQLIAMLVAWLRGVESKPGDLDERDRAIEGRAMEKGLAVTGLGLLGAGFALWHGHGAVAAFHALLAGFIAADVLINAAKSYSYWRQRG